MYIWCLIHQFNLANNSAITGSESIKHILKIAEDSAKLFRGSYVKMNIWSEVAKSVPGYNSLQRLKLIGTTRWSSKPNAVATIISDKTNLFVLIKALIKICSLKKLDGKKLEDACENLNSWVNYENIVTTFVIHKIFTVINQTTLLLQKADLNVLEGIKSLKKCNQMLGNLKDQLYNYFEEAGSFVKQTNVLLSDDEEIRSLECECVIHLPTEEENQEIIDKLQIEFYKFIETLQDRINDNILLQFDHEENLYHEMHTLDPLHAKDCLMSGTESIRILKLCEINNVNQDIVMHELKELISGFFRYQNRHQYVSVLNNCNDKNNNNCVEDSDEEITMVIENDSDLDETTADIRSPNVKYEVMPKICYCLLCILKYVGADVDRKKKFANISKLYQYIAMIPATQVKCERNFSKMKLIKTRLRANLTDKSMENLMLISSESNMFEHIDLDDIVDQIIKKSTRISLYMDT